MFRKVNNYFTMYQLHVFNSNIHIVLYLYLKMKKKKNIYIYRVGKILWRRKWKPTPIFLAWKFPWTEEPGRLQSMGLQRIRHN